LKEEKLLAPIQALETKAISKKDLFWEDSPVKISQVKEGSDDKSISLV